MIRRREFITLLGGATTAWPLAARAQQGDRVRRIGVLMPGDETDPLVKPRVSAFTLALAALGSTDGRNVRMDLRWALDFLDVQLHCPLLFLTGSPQSGGEPPHRHPHSQDAAANGQCRRSVDKNKGKSAMGRKYFTSRNGSQRTGTERVHPELATASVLAFVSLRPALSADLGPIAPIYKTAPGPADAVLHLDRLLRGRARRRRPRTQDFRGYG